VATRLSFASAASGSCRIRTPTPPLVRYGNPLSGWMTPPGQIARCVAVRQIGSFMPQSLRPEGRPRHQRGTPDLSGPNAQASMSGNSSPQNAFRARHPARPWQRPRPRCAVRLPIAWRCLGRTPPAAPREGRCAEGGSAVPLAACNRPRATRTKPRRRHLDDEGLWRVRTRRRGTPPTRRCARRATRRQSATQQTAARHRRRTSSVPRSARRRTPARTP
jgi:hypothetical protein